MTTDLFPFINTNEARVHQWSRASILFVLIIIFIVHYVYFMWVIYIYIYMHGIRLTQLICNFIETRILWSLVSLQHIFISSFKVTNPICYCMVNIFFLFASVEDKIYVYRQVFICVCVCLSACVRPLGERSLKQITWLAHDIWGAS